SPLLNTTTPLPNITTPLPTDITPLPTDTTPLPNTTTPLHTDTTPLPNNTASLDNTTTPLPTDTTPLPNTTTPLPTGTTPLPNTTTTPLLNTTTPVANTTTPLPSITTTTLSTTTTPLPITTSTSSASSTPTTTSAPSTTPSPPTAPTTAVLCLNGGMLVGGVCVCPDEWTGATCSEENFCRAKQLDEFTFKRTPAGWFAYSEEVCPKGTSGADKPRAATRCSSKNGPPSFEYPPQVLKCDQTLSDIQQNLTGPADLETLASSTQILTSKPEELTTENVTAAAQIANTLLLSANATESVRVAAVATVSQLLNTSTADDGEENSATLGLTVTLDELAVNLSLNLNTSQSQLVQPNLVVQSARVPAAHTKGVQFTALSGASGSFVADRIRLNTNTSTVTVENGFIADAVMFVRFPPEEAVSAHETPSNVSLGFVLYQNDRFFSSRRYRRRRATIRVLSASVRGQSRSAAPQQLEMLFRPTVLDGTSLFDFSCVFWDYSLEDWSSAGCWKGNASDGLLQCFCNHTTNFAALWSFTENYEYAEALDVVSVVGLSLSILGLVVTIIHHLKDTFQRKSGGRQSFKNSKLALLSICVSLLAFIITFLSGVTNRRQLTAPAEVDRETNAVLDSDRHVEPDRGSCTAVAALLHFLLLAAFTWTCLYGTQLLMLVRTLQQNLPSFWTPLSVAVGWGVPAVVMATTLGATYSGDDPLGYRQEEFCWLAALDKNKHFDFGKPMFWGFLLPLAMILIYNVVLLVLVSLTTCRTDPALT
ncbi:adhesion G-protein coupled receptor G7, partial [Plectropomus leopardus]|uniref:adhesion G-protein coupled receptor G7 n=1 Tax=Plectropomus leopardus TaxID=160734 RepID=UPI001C4B5318